MYGVEVLYTNIYISHNTSEIFSYFLFWLKKININYCKSFDYIGQNNKICLSTIFD